MWSRSRKRTGNLEDRGEQAAVPRNDERSNSCQNFDYMSPSGSMPAIPLLPCQEQHPANGQVGQPKPPSNLAGGGGGSAMTMLPQDDRSSQNKRARPHPYSSTHLDRKSSLRILSELPKLQFLLSSSQRLKSSPLLLRQCQSHND
jgi:hypothetical protein